MACIVASAGKPICCGCQDASATCTCDGARSIDVWQVHGDTISDLSGGWRALLLHRLVGNV